MSPRNLLHLEGAVVFVLSVLLYFQQGGPWWLFVLLLLAPDLAAAGYLLNPRMGSATYNAIHIYLWPLALLIYGFYEFEPLAIELGLIWAAHIGMDRMLGYGLKYPSAFKDTHLQRV